MQVNLEKNAVKTSETLFECTHEQGFESDIILPDYCPDVARILKCTANAKVIRCYHNLNRIETDGVVAIRVYYLCEESKIHSYSTTVPFSKSVSLGDTPDTLFVRVKPKIQYTNCRAVNSRRFDIRGAVELFFTAIAEKEKTLVCECEDKNICLKKQTLTNSSITGEVCRTFSVTDEFSTETRITNIFRTNAVAYPSECKVIANKIIIKGEMLVTLTTQDDECQTTSFTHTVPISQIIDLENLSEESVCTVDFDVVSLEVSHRANESGATLSLSGKVSVCVTAREQGQITFCDDAYSLSADVECKSEHTKVTSLCEHIDTKVVHRHHLNLPQNSTLIDLWYEQGLVSGTSRDGAFYIDLPITVMFIFTTADGECQYGEEIITVSERREKGEQFDGVARVCECVLTPNEVVFSVRICGDVMCASFVNAICDLTPTDTPINRSDCALTIYFSQKGEKVWDIAKRYRTKMESICHENGIENDEVSGGIMIIPTGL